MAITSACASPNPEPRTPNPEPPAPNPEPRRPSSLIPWPCSEQMMLQLGQERKRAPAQDGGERGHPNPAGAHGQPHAGGEPDAGRGGEPFDLHCVAGPE